jgi:hypothetical protein
VEGFHLWLVGSQLAPVFRARPAVRTALVLVFQHGPLIPREAGSLTLWVVYSMLDAVDLDGASDALAHGTPDPNLPPGVAPEDLYAISEAEGLSVAPRISYLHRQVFRGQRRDATYGHYEFVEGFAVAGTFVRSADGSVQCLRHDARFSSHLDRYL